MSTRQLTGSKGPGRRRRSRSRIRYHEGYIGDSAAFRVPRDRYFAVGDNSSLSCDSLAFGTIPEPNIVTRILAIYWPPPGRAHRFA